MKTRTFGVEIEVCDFDRQKIILPSGFEWDEEEKIDNTDGSCNKRRGGEINSSPLLYSKESFDLLEGVLAQVFAAGGRISWMVDIHVHIYAGDLSVEQLKNLVFFEYITYPYFRQYCKIEEWNELVYSSKPLITEAKFNAIKESSMLNDMDSKKSVSRQNKIETVTKGEVVSDFNTTMEDVPTTAVNADEMKKPLTKEERERMINPFGVDMTRRGMNKTTSDPNNKFFK